MKDIYEGPFSRKIIRARKLTPRSLVDEFIYRTLEMMGDFSGKYMNEGIKNLHLYSIIPCAKSHVEEGDDKRLLEDVGMMEFIYKSAAPEELEAVGDGIARFYIAPFSEELVRMMESAGESIIIAVGPDGGRYIHIATILDPMFKKDREEIVSLDYG